MSVVAATGFRATGVSAGLKASGAPDLALVVNDGPDAVAAAVFTRNRVVAAPVTWTRAAVADGRIVAMVLNSGGANACTGSAGTADVAATAAAVADGLGVAAGDVAVASTGLIGVRLPMPALLAGVRAALADVARPSAVAEPAGLRAAAAIMTTDTVPKTATVTVDGVTVGGMAKGAGMLAPALATMLVVLTTDAVVDRRTLDAALRAATAVTFDRVDADGCMSTNDTVLAMASGASGVPLTLERLTDAMRAVCADLAAQLVADAEGASKEVAVTVHGAATEDDALEVARAVARNNLVKCALHGGDPNWGRILAAVGTTGAAFDPGDLAVALNEVWLARGGAAVEPEPTVDLRPRAVTVDVDLGAGVATATVWTTDLTADYVHENSAYSS